MKKISVFVMAVMIIASMSYAAGKSDKSNAKEMVVAAEAFVKAHGKEQAIIEFNNPKGKFVKKDLYVFAYDMNGTLIAIPTNPKLVGKNLIDVPDTDGKLYRKDILDIAKSKGEGWVDYKYKNPETNKIEAKTTYFKKVGDIIICCGAYK
jgi:cytochrome c